MRALALIALLALAGCGGSSTPAPKAPDRIALTSPAFRAGGKIPKRFTCDGAGTSPPLRFDRVPAGSRELVLLMEDPDAPGGTFVHWVVARIPARTIGFPAGHVPPGAAELRRYTGPCPPKGDHPHRYVLTLYALGRRMTLSAGDVPSKLTGALALGRLRASYGR